MLDSRVGRWFKTDPLEKIYPSVSAYNYTLNNPISAIDPDGKVVLFFNGMHTGDGGRSEYWGKYASSFMEKVGDYSARYYDGAMGGAKQTLGMATAGGFTGFGLTGGNPFGAIGGTLVGVFSGSNVNKKQRMLAGEKMGFTQAKEIYENLSEGETVKIVTHSMGTAYSRGFVKGLKKWAKENNKTIRIEYELDVAAFQGSELNKPASVEKLQYKSGKADGLANGTWGDILAGGTGSSDIPAEKNVENISPKDPNVGHGIGGFDVKGVPTLGNGNKNDIKGKPKTVYEETPKR